MNDPIKVSVIVLTRNEEANLQKCLASVARFSEVFVVDSLSADRTREIAEQSGAHVVDFAWNGQYPKKKQWALENLPFSNDWVLYLDADEELTTAVANEIENEVQRRAECTAGYFVTLDYLFLGDVLSHGLRVRKLILFNRFRGHFEEIDDLEAKNMWEVEGHYQPRIDGPVRELSGTLIHDDHDTLYHYFERHNRYSDWEATLRTSPINGSHPGSLDLSISKRMFNRLPFKPVAFFLHSYLVKGGFLDGRAGFHYAVAKAFYYWQIRVKELELVGRR